MAQRVFVLVGTKKGAFIAESDAARQNWDVRGPFCEAWPINHVAGDPAERAIYAGGGNEWYGQAVWKTCDFGATWTHSSEGLTFGEGQPPVAKVWSLKPAHGFIYAGTDPAGLFRSRDGGQTWEHVAGLRNHPSCPEWQPGNGGLILHSIVPHPSDEKQMWVGISSVGVFHTADGGDTWQTQNKGVRFDYFPDPYPEFGQCVHSMGMGAGKPDWLYQQNQIRFYRSRDGGQVWEEKNEGLPSTFGFAMAAHPADPNTVFTAPLNGDSKGRFMPDGKAAVWRTKDGGDTWHALRDGLPQENAYFGILRQALAVDTLPTPGVYFGSNNGQLFASSDEGETWRCIAPYLPPIWSVSTMVVNEQ